MVLKGRWLNMNLAIMAMIYYSWRWNMKNKGAWIGWRVMLCQCMHESGTAGKPFNSPLFLRSNNCCGMGVPKSRKWFGNGETNGYSTYFTSWQCIRDLFEWIDTRGDGSIYLACPEAREAKASALNSWWGWDEYHKMLEMKDYYTADPVAYYEASYNWIDQAKNTKNPWIGLLIWAFIPTLLFIGYLFFPKCREWIKSTVKRIFKRNG